MVPAGHLTDFESIVVHRPVLVTDLGFEFELIPI
jgi:hypothetical protein